MPKKIKELKKLLKKAGFTEKTTKGSHTKWSHPLLSGKIILSGKDEDGCYIVSLPEWGEFCHTHGDTYEEALKNAQEVLELLIESAKEDGETLPQPETWQSSFQIA